MTREEAIKELKELEYYGRFFDNSETEDKKNKALFMAIEAIEQEPCEDAISRQAVLDGLASIAKAKAKSDAQKSMMGRTMFFVEQLPSVSTEKTGRWIPVSERLPELNKPLWVTAYHRVCYAHMISKNGNYGYPVFRLHELKDSDRVWVQETISHEPYSKGRIDAWMYIDIPQPYNVESEDDGNAI